jgi:hypothetical protein
MKVGSGKGKPPLKETRVRGSVTDYDYDYD